MTGTLAVDIGQTGFRLLLNDDRAGTAQVVESPLGVEALTGSTDVGALAQRIVDHVPRDWSPSCVGVGLSGFVEGSEAPAALAAGLHERLRPRSTVVAADAVTAFLGTIGARPGTVVICGTGVAALGVGPSGTVRRIDARGYLLGDFGGGFWLGQRGLHAALDAIEGRGEPTALARSSMRLGGPREIYHGAMGSTPAPKFIAGFAPDVLDAAAGGDPVARHILDAGADQLALTIRTARIADGPVGLTGGLTRSAIYVDAIHAALLRLDVEAGELLVVPDASLAGARIVAEDMHIRSAFAGFIEVKESE
jgi:N-acetylglucosamine kinase-like BadF-type ATPase